MQENHARYLLVGWLNSLTPSAFKFLFFCGMSLFYSDICSEFQSYVRSLVCILHRLGSMDFSDSPLMQLLLTTWQAAVQLRLFEPHACTKINVASLVGLKFGIKCAAKWSNRLCHSVSVMLTSYRFTARKQSCGKVMFHRCLFIGRCVSQYTPGQGGGVVYTPCVPPISNFR